jgi:hypothetical protein
MKIRGGVGVCSKPILTLDLDFSIMPPAPSLSLSLSLSLNWISHIHASETPKPNFLHCKAHHSSPTLFAAAPCFFPGSNALEEDAIISSARKTALRRSIPSRRGSVSVLVRIANGAGTAARFEERELVLSCAGRIKWLLSFPAYGFGPVEVVVLSMSRSALVNFSLWSLMEALILLILQKSAPLP